MSMSKELEKYLKRVQTINEYGYRFHQPMTEVEEEMPADNGGDDLGDLDIPDTGDQVEGGDEFNAGDGEPTDDLDGMDSGEAPMEDPVEDTQEIDVTELVDTNKDIQNRINSLEQMQQNSSQIIQKINGSIDQLNASYTTLSSQLQKIDAIQLSLKKMEPPTEDERREAMAQTSYPFKTTLPSYDQTRKETQTDLENNSGKRILTKQDIMRDYNEMDISRSFGSNMQ